MGRGQIGAGLHDAGEACLTDLAYCKLGVSRTGVLNVLYAPLDCLICVLTVIYAV